MPSNRSAMEGSNGFTLIELLITLAVAAILLTVAVPAMQGIIQRNTLTVATDKLIHAIQYTRSEAIRQGRQVTLCKSADGVDCATTGDWSQGWIVYAPETDGAPANLLRVQAALAPQIKITGNSNVETDIVYDTLGFGHGSNGTLTVEIENTTRVIEVVISNTGRVRTQFPG